jgi:hypothetical protein
MAAWLHQLTCPRQRAFAPGHQARYPASYTKAPAGEPVLPLPSCCLSAAGVCFLGILSRQGLPPLLRSAYRAMISADPGGVYTFRTRESRTGPGALCTPGTAVPTRPRGILGRRLPHPSGVSLSPRQYNPARDVGVTRHQRGFPDSRPSGPSPDLWPPWLEQRPSGFPVSSAPGRSGTGHARHGGDGSDTDP